MHTVNELLWREEQNFKKYEGLFVNNKLGPFGSNKILSHPHTVSKILNHPEHVRPVTVEIHVTNTCQHRCPNCMYRDAIRNTDNSSVSLKNPIKIIEDLHDYDVKAIVYTGGGEPLMHSDIDAIMTYGKDFGISQGLITNGGLIGNHIEAIIRNCEWVRISLDSGSEETRQMMHGVRDYKRTIQAIEKLVSHNNAGVRIGASYLLTAFNAYDLLEAIKHLKSIGVSYLQIKPLIMSKEEKISSGNIFWDEGIFNILEIAKEMASGDFDIYLLGNQFMSNFNGHKDFRKCHGHALCPVITATGHIYVCCMHIGNEHMSYGKITDDISFKDIWESPSRYRQGSGININNCPNLCRLSQTNKILENILSSRSLDSNFLN